MITRQFTHSGPCRRYRKVTAHRVLLSSITTSVQSHMDLLFHTAVYRRITTAQVASSFLRYTRVAMTGTAVTMFRFSLSRQSEPFLGSLMGFLFRHLLEPCTNANMDHGLYEVPPHHGRGATPFKSQLCRTRPLANDLPRHLASHRKMIHDGWLTADLQPSCRYGKPFCGNLFRPEQSPNP